MIPSISLTRDEKEVLLTKYRNSGLSTVKAQKRVNSFALYLDKIVKELTMKKKPAPYIQNKFKEEFEKICMKLEV